MSNRIFFYFFVILTISACSESKYAGPLSPQASMSTFQLEEGFKVELFASEPHIMDPVSMVIDETGNVFVVEMPDYPYKPEPGEGKGRIKVLIDEDHDGTIDESVVFAESIAEATSILPWQGGLLVTAAPNILYLKDNDGDFVADQEEILFTGFFENNSEAQITNLRYSIDNWIYAANHGQAGEVVYTRQPDRVPLLMAGGDFRFRLDRNAYELTTGPAQFGQTIDDWGNRFITHNTIHIRQVVMPRPYLDRNPFIPSKKGVENISDHDLEMFQRTPPPYWRAERTRRRQQQYKEQNLDRVEYAEDHFTGSSGGTMYNGDAFPAEYYGAIFTGDVAGNLVHMDLLEKKAGSPLYQAIRSASQQEKEFLSSTDPWFRPANSYFGPDGSLYVIDMYRQHIETPLSIPEDLKEDMDFYNGMNKGRIYRISPSDQQPEEKMFPDLRQQNATDLVKLLAHPNQWWRLQAQRLLVEKQSNEVISELEAMFLNHADPRAKLHAFYTLEGLNVLSIDLIQAALKDQSSAIRMHGIKQAEKCPTCFPSIIACIQDSSDQVVYQAALSLGWFNNEQSRIALSEVLRNKGEDEWFRKAILTSKAGSSIEFVKVLNEEPEFYANADSWKLDFMQDLSQIIGARDQQSDMIELLSMMKKNGEAYILSCLQGINQGLEHSKNINSNTSELNSLLAGLESKFGKDIKEQVAEIQNKLVKNSSS